MPQREAWALSTLVASAFCAWQISGSGFGHEGPAFSFGQVGGLHDSSLQGHMFFQWMQLESRFGFGAR